MSTLSSLVDLLKRTTAVRYIKLGDGGRWESDCIDKEGAIRLGYQSPFHVSSVSGDWGAVEAYWITQVKNEDAGAAKRAVGQIKDFYTQPETCLWFTFYQRKLWWCLAHPEVQERADDGSRIRKAVCGWHDTSVNGQPLHMAELDGRITKVVGYRGTICRIGGKRKGGRFNDEERRLLRRLLDEPADEVKGAKAHREKLEANLKKIIQGLSWQDFELFVDQVFSRSGWSRVSALGKTEKSIDLEMSSPLSGRRAFVQVKSRADSGTIKQCVSDMRKLGNPERDEVYFVAHTLIGRDKAALHDNEPRSYVMDVDRLARRAVDTGLVGWLIRKGG